MRHPDAGVSPVLSSSKPRILAALAVSSVLLLGACDGSDDEPSAEQDDAVTDAESNGSSPEGNGDDEGADEQDAEAAADLPPRPENDECVDITPPDDGRYAVYDAGHVVVERDGDRLAVGELDGATSWTLREIDPDDDDVEVQFRNAATDEVLELQVEVADDSIEAEICADNGDDDDDDD